MVCRHTSDFRFPAIAGLERSVVGLSSSVVHMDGNDAHGPKASCALGGDRSIERYTMTRWNITTPIGKRTCLVFRWELRCVYVFAVEEVVVPKPSQDQILVKTSVDRSGPFFRMTYQTEGV